MYNIGMCKVCNQGLLEVVKDSVTGKIYICCDECEAEWGTPIEALVNQGGSRGKYGKIIYPCIDEIREQQWETDIFEHYN